MGVETPSRKPCQGDEVASCRASAHPSWSVILGIGSMGIGSMGIGVQDVSVAVDSRGVGAHYRTSPCMQQRSQPTAPHGAVGARRFWEIGRSVIYAG